MARSKQNPEMGGILTLAGIAAAAYFAYTQGWFNSVTTTVEHAPAPKPTTGTTNPVTNPATQIVNMPSTAPPLGTVVNNANDVAAQIAAKYPYIIPDPNNVNALGGQIVQAGYTNFTYNVANDAVTGLPVRATIYVRKDVGSAVQADIANRVAKATAAGAAQESINNAGYDNLAQIQSAMARAGLSGVRGLGFSSPWAN